MNTNMIALATHLTDAELVAQVKVLAQREREATSVLIAHLSVLDERRLYLAEGCSSMFMYCVQVLHLSEYAAYSRIEAARAARKYPVILDMLSDGSVNLTTVGLLVPELTAENYLDLLEHARHKSKRQVQELVAALRPQAFVPSSVRRLPISHHNPAAATGDTLRFESRDDLSSPPAPSPMSLSPIPPPPAATTLSSPVVVAPLAPARYKVQFTATAETHAKLLRAQDLLRHQIPDGDIGEIIDLALTVLLRNVAKQKVGATDRPREKGIDLPAGNRDMVPRSRHIPAEVRRAVWHRDSGRCAFVSPTGRRCAERGFLEFHHVVPYSAGGTASVNNIQLRCRAHNAYEAERVFGATKWGSVRESDAPYGISKEPIPLLRRQLPKIIRAGPR